MAAVVTIKRWTGSPKKPTKTDITAINTRANAEDAHSTADTKNPIVIPAKGKQYSYWVSTRLSVDAITHGTIDNVRWHTDGSNSLGTGVGASGNAASSYVQATGTEGVGGTQLTIKNYPSLIGEPTDVFGFTANSPKVVSGTTKTTGDFADFFIYQIVVGTGASAGTTGAEIFTWKYDDSSS